MGVASTTTATAFPETEQTPVVATHGIRLDVDHVSRRRDGALLLDGVSFSIAPGELVAIVGPSGAGKTSLLEVIAGIASPTSGAVRFDGADLRADRSAFRTVLGYVPQDDIIHADLPLVHTIRYAARLRLPSSTGTAAIDATVQTCNHGGRPRRAQRRSGRGLEWWRAQACEHRGRAADRSTHLLSGRADVRARSGHQCGRRQPTAPACRRNGDRGLHHALHRRPSTVRSRSSSWRAAAAAPLSEPSQKHSRTSASIR